MSSLTKPTQMECSVHMAEDWCADLAWKMKFQSAYTRLAKL